MLLPTLDALEEQIGMLGRQGLQFLCNSSGQAQALAFVGARDQLGRARALVAQTVVDPVNLMEKVERAIPLASVLRLT